MPTDLKRIESLHLWLLAAAIAAVAPWNMRAAASLALGGGVMALNVWLMHQIFRRLVGWSRPALLFGLLKVAVFLALLALLVVGAPVDPVGLAAGVTLMLVSAVVVSLRTRPSPLQASPSES